ncbi:hypothetical protein FNF27_07679 [Cafeteria roenbergensis]|uniref:ABC transporter domain-containing protein n=1 Tax=Cafeteria roenbergensis TaxID=33653 RepID=A0A5A8DJ14_CAFRO|nr:hypothetical protein FNF27_07679 [Cafeteria roenbergensis]
MLPALFVLVVSVSQIGNDPQPPAPPGPPSRPETPYELQPGLLAVLAPFTSSPGELRIEVSPSWDNCTSALAGQLQADLTALNASLATTLQLVPEATGSRPALGIHVTSSPSMAPGAQGPCPVLGAAATNSSWGYDLRLSRADSPAPASDSGQVVFGHPFGTNKDASAYAYFSWAPTVALQSWVDGALHRAQGAPSAAAPPSQRGDGAFPQRILPLAQPANPWRNTLDPALNAFLPSVPLLGPIFFWALAASAFNTDTNGGMRESLRIRGLRPAAYWGAKLLGYFVLSLPAAAALTGALYVVRTVVLANAGLVFVALWACVLAGIPMAAAVSQLAARSSTAFAIVNASFIPVFGIWATVSLAVTTTSTAGTVLAMIAPQFAFVATFSTISALDTLSGGLSVENFGAAPTPSSVPVSIGLVGALSSFVLWLAVALVVDHIRTSSAAGGDAIKESPGVVTTNPAVRKLDPEATLGKRKDECLVIEGAVKVFSSVQGKRAAVEMHNDELRCKALGFDVAPSSGKRPGCARSACRSRGSASLFHAPSDLLAVGGVDLVVAPGHLTCLLGHNGSGKTTLMSMMTAGLDRTLGRISYFGVDLVGSNAAQLCMSIGYCPQANLLVPGMTAREHLELFWGMSSTDVEKRDARVEEVLGLVGLDKDADRAVDMFSGGMRRKLAFAGAILRPECRVLLLDEPTSGCDPATRRHIWDLILDARRAGKCIVLTTHELSEAELLADQVVVLKRGRVEACGSKLALKKHFTNGYKVTATLSEANAAKVGAGLGTAPAAASSASAGGAESGPESAFSMTTSRLGGEAREDDSSDATRVEACIDVPWDAAERLPSVFESLAAAEASGVSISQDSLESVFLAITQAKEVPTDGATATDVEARFDHSKAGSKRAGCCGSGRKVTDSEEEEAASEAEEPSPKDDATTKLADALLRVHPQPSTLAQVRTLFWARCKNPQTCGVMMIPVLYVTAMVVLLSLVQLVSAPKSVVPEPVELSAAPLLSRAFAVVTSSQEPRGDQLLFAEQFVCSALGMSGPSALPTIAAAAGANNATAGGFRGCGGVNTTSPVPATPTRETFVIGGTATLLVYDNITAMQDDALSAAQYFAHGADSSASASGVPIQLAGGLVFPGAPSINASSYFPSASSAAASARPQMGVSLLVNTSLPAAVAVLRRALSEASSRLAAGDGGATVATTVFPAVVDVPASFNLAIGIVFPIMMGISMTNALSLGGAELARDNDNGMRVKMRVMGLRSYFAGLMAADVALLAPVFVLATVVSAAAGTVVMGDSRWYGFLLGSLASILPVAMTYYLVASVSRMSEASASAVLPIAGAVLGMVIYMMSAAVGWSGKPEDVKVSEQLFGILAFDPMANYFFLLDRLARLDAVVSRPASGAFTAEQVLGWDTGIGYNLMWCAIATVVLGALLWGVEHTPEVRYALGCAGTSGSEGRDRVKSSGAEAASASPAGLDESVSAELTRADLMRDEEGGIVGRGLTMDVRTRAGETRRVLDNWTLGVRKGEVVALLGPAGAGKTTAMRALVGDSSTQQTMTGQVSLSGKALGAMPGHVGYCPQDDAMWPTLTPYVHMHVFAAIRGLSVSERGPIIEGVADATDLTRHLHKQTSKLSGGNKRKLGLATAVMGLPAAVVYDEPSTGVDPAARRAIWAIIRAAKPRCAQLVSTHSMDEAASLGDRVAIMANGRLLTIGTPSDLKDRFCDAYFVEVELTSDGAADRVLAELRGFPGLKVRDRVGAVLKMELARGRTGRSRLLAQIFKSLAALDNKDVSYFSVTEPSLEEAFLAVVSADGARGAE